jgi:hypothetical protein
MTSQVYIATRGARLCETKPNSGRMGDIGKSKGRRWAICIGDRSVPNKANLPAPSLCRWRTHRAKQSQFASGNALRRHYERGRLRRTKPICVGGPSRWTVPCRTKPMGSRPLPAPGRTRFLLGGQFRLTGAGVSRTYSANLVRARVCRKRPCRRLTID